MHRKWNGQSNDSIYLQIDQRPDSMRVAIHFLDREIDFLELVPYFHISPYKLRPRDDGMYMCIPNLIQNTFPKGADFKFQLQ